MKVKFMPQNVEFDIPQGQSVMNLAHEKGIPIRSTCNGLPSCAECRVRVTDGDWNTNPPSRKELSLIGTGYYIDQRRLSCQVLCFGDITVDTQEQVEKAGEGPVTKKFLNKVHKASAEDTHSVGGVLIEQDEQLLAELKQAGLGGGGRDDDFSGSASLEESRGGGGHGGGRDRGRGQQQARGGQQGGGQNRNQGGGQNRGQQQARGGGQHQGGGNRGGGPQPRDGQQQMSGEQGQGGPREGGSGGRRRRRGGRGRNRGGGGGGGQGGQGGGGGNRAPN